MNCDVYPIIFAFLAIYSSQSSKGPQLPAATRDVRSGFS
jgi:hypothetical protein